MYTIAHKGVLPPLSDEQRYDRMQEGLAPQIMAVVRNLVITLIHRSGSSQIAASRRSFAYHPRLALAFLFAIGGPQQ